MSYIGLIVSVSYVVIILVGLGAWSLLGALKHLGQVTGSWY